MWIERYGRLTQEEGDFTTRAQGDQRTRSDAGDTASLKEAKKSMYHGVREGPVPGKTRGNTKNSNRF